MVITGLCVIMWYKTRRPSVIKRGQNNPVSSETSNLLSSPSKSNNPSEPSYTGL